ncbi:uncharacterized protein C3orf84-like isoform X4 [Stegostoma tigrinum]|uniref:uncharacterized protein C3orf84-like isoform X4 n=1 Tax=Stegostoma tigrinum TaxID=3053191 RepID=UPI00202B1E5F|nr:uncharacterized protein C3orf84-like isoform X4 [Stegostoma tigrinum]
MNMSSSLTVLPRKPLHKAHINFSDTMAGAITGSWFPTGFHGHARSKSRNDVFQEYRQRAKPPPPEKLINRLRENPLKHNFSKHDSRQVFHDSATYLENSNAISRAKTAFGRRSEFKKDFMSWIPIQTDSQQQWPLISTYKADFWHHRNPQSTKDWDTRKQTRKENHDLLQHKRRVLVGCTLVGIGDAAGTVGNIWLDQENKILEVKKKM